MSSECSPLEQINTRRAIALLRKRITEMVGLYANLPTYAYAEQVKQVIHKFHQTRMIKSYDISKSVACISRELVWCKHRWQIQQTFEDGTTDFEKTGDAYKIHDDTHEWQPLVQKLSRFRSRRLARLYLKRTKSVCVLNLVIRPNIPVEHVTVNFKVVKNNSIDIDTKYFFKFFDSVI